MNLYEFINMYLKPTANYKDEYIVDRRIFVINSEFDRCIINDCTFFMFDEHSKLSAHKSNLSNNVLICLNGKIEKALLDVLISNLGAIYEPT